LLAQRSAAQNGGLGGDGAITGCLADLPFARRCYPWCLRSDAWMVLNGGLSFARLGGTALY
jgi:hypothetical protein